MPFCADDEQSSGCDDLFGFGPDLLLELFVELSVMRTRRHDLFGDRLRGTGGKRDDRLVVLLLAHLCLREIFRVAAEQDVGTTACHIR